MTPRSRTRATDERLRRSPHGRGAARGAFAGVASVGLFVASAAVSGTPPDFDASGAVVAEYFAERQTRIQIGAALAALAMPLLVWFLAAVLTVATDQGRPGSRQTATVAFGSGLVFIALYLTDVAALCVGALRPESMASAPELASALHDFSWMAPAIAAFFGAAMLCCFAVLSLRDEVWPRLLGWAAALAALCYSLRIGALFTTDGPFAADGVLGLYVPVVALSAWVVAAGLSLGLRAPRRAGAG